MKRPPVLPEAFSSGLDPALFRRLQTGRIEPLRQMRCGVGTSCPEQQILALATRRKCLGFLAVSFRLNADLGATVTMSPSSVMKAPCVTRGYLSSVGGLARNESIYVCKPVCCTLPPRFRESRL